ncbi:ComEA family DNA-binding protein [Psychromonas algicola]|uniref:ComEA family DNA-binding protein n=1 Tax=Psychromonas algicola TaxID=2555642 RepID=UPI0010685332|nr:helix-hairpin-helix domain-containing protein [Psychromonas sp. RZ5]TEW52248.1 helix-hairpin-helix domain-containing protein [Psychromonas sp. RZ5]
MFNKLTRRLIIIASLFLLPISFQPLLALDVGTATIPGIEKVNINSADISQLSMIKGIGSKKAQAIIDYRTANGDFTALEDLTKVKGIGQSTLKKILPFLTL